ncbi:MAG: 4Fe-4S dicluster domain-containing protein [Treponema sp.]|jgi:electron transport complex protein RnfC|nr:4Fe-4S dicluster domain-containing protein [Treponema sp.]
MKVYSFPRGGFSYKDTTAPELNSPDIIDAFLPALTIIPLGNSGSRVQPLVSIGDTVKEGMLIGKANGPGTVNLYSPVPGRIIRKAVWKDSNSLETEALVIKLEGSFERLGKKEEAFSWRGMSRYDLQRIISDFGIVEMENFGRPLADIISGFRKDNEKITLVVRCVFDDPWLAADYALCRERLKAVVEGAIIVYHACSKASNIIFAVSHLEKKMGEDLLAEARHYDIPAALVLTSSRYPQRQNRELELALRIYEKKESLALGAFLILGPAVLAAAHDAVKYKRPILDRYVAVGGSAVKRAKIMKVRIGTRIGELIEQCEGFNGKPERIAAGSPLSGKQIKYLDEPIMKTSFAIVAMLKTQASLHKMQNCINCGECRTVCPVGLDPQNIYKKIVIFGMEAATTGCHGCGCCKVVCPSALPLSETIQGGV